MAAGLEQRTLRMYCPTHRVCFSVTEAARILCTGGPHVLARNFPFEEFWEYCCDCQTFWSSNVLKVGEAVERCPVCERRIARHYLCDRCQVFSVESDEPPPQGKSFSIPPTGAVQPSCPGCLRAATSAAQKHRCKELGINFTTPRALCPFCNEATALPVEKILSAFNELRRAVETIQAEQQRLAASFHSSITLLEQSLNKQIASLRDELSESRQEAQNTAERRLYELSVRQNQITHALSAHANLPEILTTLDNLQCTVNGIGQLLTKTSDRVMSMSASPQPTLQAAPSDKHTVSKPIVSASEYRRNVVVFPISAEDYLNRASSDLVPIEYDFIRMMLVMAGAGEGTMFLVNEGGSPSDMSYVVPGVKRFQKRGDFDTYYSDYFDCPNPSGGEITIIRPALVYRVVGGWQLYQKGELKV